MDNMSNEFQSPKPADKKGLAIASMVLGIISLVFFCLWYICIPCAILAIIFSALSLKSSGRGMAIAGMVLSIIALSIDIIVVVIVGATIFSMF